MGLSKETQRKQKTSKEGYLRRVGLEAREEVGAQSVPLANTHGKADLQCAWSVQAQSLCQEHQTA